MKYAVRFQFETDGENWAWLATAEELSGMGDSISTQGRTLTEAANRLEVAIRERSKDG